MSNMSISSSLSSLASMPGTTQASRSRNWFEAFATTWGEALDKQASVIETRANQLGNNVADKPSDITMLTAESMRMGFMSNSSHASLDSIAKALETMARKG